MRAVWMVRSRELASRLRFWTSIVGYDPRDHSVSHRLYLVYLVIFFSLWGFSVLILLAEAGIWVLSLIKELAPAMAATAILLALMLIDALVRSYKASKRSPFVFSAEDAGLICQTPVDRRQVALAWLFGDWLPACLPFVALAIILCFASLQLAEQGPFLWSYLPSYWLAAFRVTSTILPLHLALMAGVYTLGSLRLRGQGDIPAMSWVPIGFGITVLSLALTNKGYLETILFPLILPLEAGLGAQKWLPGFVLALFLSLVGMMALYISSPRLNLSRAAQESHSRWAYAQASMAGDAHLTQGMKIRDRLGAQHQPSRLPARSGARILIWKDWVVSLRAVNLGHLVAWLAIFQTGLAVVISTDWGIRIWALVIWCWLVGQRGTQRLRSDLELWVISRQLPFTGRAMVVAEHVLPVLGMIVITWLAIGLGSLFGFSAEIIFILLSPPAIISIVLAASFDMLRKCHSSELLAGQVAEPGVEGLVLGGLFAGIPLVMVYWLTNQINLPVVNFMVILFGFALSSGVSYLMWRLTASAYRGIK